MSECECLAVCPFFNDKMPLLGGGLVEIYKENYCKKDKDSCARYMVRKALGKEKVPPDLYPNMRDKANQVIAASQQPA